MKLLELNPDQIITLNDYPVYSNTILSGYFDKCISGEKIPFVPVISKRVVKKCFDDNLKKIFVKFEESNPMAEYFMLDGSHRTTALTLTNLKIPTIVFEEDKDIEKSQKLISDGQILENDIFEHMIKENCEILNKHFSQKPYFMTVKQKTNKMIEGKILPNNLQNRF